MRASSRPANVASSTRSWMRITSSSMTRSSTSRYLGSHWHISRTPGRRSPRSGVSCKCRSLSTPAQDVFFERLERLAIRRARTPSHHALFGEPWVLTNMLEMAGFTDVKFTQLLVGVRAADVHEWTELMQWSGPWPHAMIGLLSPGARATFEEELDRTMHRLGEGDYAFHGAFTLATGRLRDQSPAQPSAESALEETLDVSAVRSSLYASDSEPAFPSP